jgi:fission process protein 1
MVGTAHRTAAVAPAVLNDRTSSAKWLGAGVVGGAAIWLSAAICEEAPKPEATMSAPTGTAKAAVANSASKRYPKESQAVDTKEKLETRDTALRYGGFMARAHTAFISGKLAAMKAVGANIRFAAYGSDFGEGLRPVLSDVWVKAAYGVSISYVIGDIIYHTWHAKEAGLSDTVVLRTAVHATVFQFLASLAMPYVIIHTAVKKSTTQFVKMGKFVKWGPSIVGLSLIPFLPLVDEPAEFLIDGFFDKVWPLSDEDEVKLEALEDAEEDDFFVPAHHHKHLRATARDALNAGNVDEASLKQLFTEIDADSSGHIDVPEMGTVLRAKGVDISDKDLHNLVVRGLANHDDRADKADGQLNFDEFKQMMKHDGHDHGAALPEKN